MCNPLAIGAVMAVAGTAMQVRAQQQREREMNNFQRAESERQQEIQNKAKPLLAENREEYSRESIDSKMAAEATKRAAEYDAQAANAPQANEPLAGSQQSGNVVVLDAFRRALGDATERAGQIGQARAKLSSFGDAMQGAGLENQQRTDQLGMLGSFSAGSANVLPFELQQAATRQRGAATAGNILTSVGTSVIGGAGSGGAAGGGGWGALFGGR